MGSKGNMISGGIYYTIGRDGRSVFTHGDKSGMAIAQSHYNQCDVEPIEIMQMYFTAYLR